MATEQWVETRDAKPCGNSAHILVPKRFRGETFRLELVTDVIAMGDEDWLLVVAYFGIVLMVGGAAVMSPGGGGSDASRDAQ
ncbi:DUF2080 family transposase-associated protein [Salinigranum sp. GCM10025319]|uniref:DUF2080 family transposase-associated protein n=1 Tax=Salinigranum sp. GCM10025319 TaxID=3252687 RepID=UPI00361892FA